MPQTFLLPRVEGGGGIVSMSRTEKAAEEAMKTFCKMVLITHAHSRRRKEELGRVSFGKKPPRQRRRKQGRDNVDFNLRPAESSIVVHAWSKRGKKGPEIRKDWKKPCKRKKQNPCGLILNIQIRVVICQRVEGHPVFRGKIL